MPPEEAGAAWGRVFDQLIAGLFRRSGEEGMASLYETDRLAYDRRYERGRQLFFGPPDERHAQVLRARGILD